MRPGGAAIVHDYFVQDGGAEHVALELARLLPEAPVYTTFFDAARFGDRLDPARVVAWPLNGRLGGDHFRSLLPLYPAWFSALDLRSFELVVSSSSAFAKAVRTSRRGLHVAYIHAPMRFAWQTDEYLRGSSFSRPSALAARAMRAPLRAWDRRTSQRPDVLIANSAAVRGRIREWWGRDAEVIHPSVRIDDIRLSATDEGFLLVAARLLAHRRIDLAVAAANASGRRLVVVGDGPERRRLERLAGSGVEFAGFVPRSQLVALFESCHAYLVPGEEDFGIAPIEAMAAGKPVVAFGRGGVAETVEDGVTGALFDEQSVAALVAALDRLDALELDPHVLRARAQEFDRSTFVAAWHALFERYGVDPRLYAEG